MKTTRQRIQNQDDFDAHERQAFDRLVAAGIINIRRRGGVSARTIASMLAELVKADAIIGDDRDARRFMATCYTTPTKNTPAPDVQAVFYFDANGKSRKTY